MRPTQEAQAEQQADPKVGLVFGNYRLLRRLGEGGMGVVYAAEHQRIHRRAAVKLLNPELVRDVEYAQRFLNEARAVNLISHPGLVEIFEFGQTPDGTLYYVMELLEGESLEHRMEQRAEAWEPGQVILLAYEITQAMAAAHEKGIIHRDLKPSNIMLIPDKDRPSGERVKILDFGIAKLSPSTSPVQGSNTAKTQMKTLHGSVMGTALYMPPEQWGQAEDVDGRADVFALGVVLYDLLASKMPYEGSSRSLLRESLTPLERVAPKVPQRLTRLVNEMLEVTAAKRPTMAEVLTQLAAMRPSRLRKRDVLIGGGIGAIAVLALVALVVGAFSRFRIPTSAQMRAKALQVLGTQLRDPNAEIRRLAVDALGDSRDSLQASPLARMVRDEKEDVAAASAKAIGQLGKSIALRLLPELLSPSQPVSIRLAAGEALARLNDKRGKAALEEIFTSGSSEAQGRAAQRLLALGDTRGAALLWGMVEKAPITPDSIRLLGRLAQSRYEPAQHRLREEFGKQKDDSPLRLQLAEQLARIGDEAAREHLRIAAHLPLPTQVSQSSKLDLTQLGAGRLLASLGEPLPASFFLSILNQPNMPEAARVLAADAFGDVADEAATIELRHALDEAQRDTAQRLLVGIAAAIVHLTTNQQAQLAEQSLVWARDALSSEEIDLRLLAVDAFADQNTDQALAALINAGADPERLVRERVVRALARRAVPAALRALSKSLSDRDEDVRAAAVAAIDQVLSALAQRGPVEGEPNLREQLLQMRRAGTELDRIAAAALLVRLKDDSGAESLKSALSSRDPRVRRIAAQFASVSADDLGRMLSDIDSVLRMTAARRLVVLRDERGVRYLREQVAGGGQDSLNAYLYLRQAGEASPPPKGLAELLESGSLLTRYAALDAVQQMDGPEAIQLLKIAALDAAAVLRGRTVRIAAALYQRNRARALLDLVRTMRGDPDVYVRSQVVQVLPVMEVQAKQAPVQAKQESISSPPVTPVAPPGARETKSIEGAIIVRGEDGVRFQVDRTPARTVSDKPVFLPPGKHRLTYAGGGQDIELSAGQIREIRLPVRLTDQLFADAREAANRKDWARSETLLKGLRNQRRSSGQSNARDAEIEFLLGSIVEARDGLVPALEFYSASLRIPPGSRRPETNAALDALLKRIGSQIARIRVGQMSGRTCLVREQLVRPGPTEYDGPDGRPVRTTLRGGQIEVAGCAPK